jgi:hypothetical protein
MRYLRFALVALAVGIVLAVLSVLLAGLIAALPLPGLAPPLRHDHAGSVLLAMDLIGALPIVVLAWLVGHVMVRATRMRSLLLFIGAPWILLGLYDRVWYLRNCGATFRTALSILLSGHYLEAWGTSLLCIPVGLGIAALTTRRPVRT